MESIQAPIELVIRVSRVEWFVLEMMRPPKWKLCILWILVSAHLFKLAQYAMQSMICRATINWREVYSEPNVSEPFSRHALWTLFNENESLLVTTCKNLADRHWGYY